MHTINRQAREKSWQVIRANLYPPLTENIRLLEEIIESDEWMEHLHVDQLLYDLAVKKQNPRIHYEAELNHLNTGENFLISNLKRQF